MATNDDILAADTSAEPSTPSIKEDLNGFSDIPFALQIVATLLGIAICLYEAIYPSMVRKEDNRERFEEYKKRYRWDQFNVDTMLHSSEEEEEAI